MGCVPPVEDFLDGLGKLCASYGALLIFDEVMTGFRVAFGGAQALYNARPDLTCLGKIIGGGLPVGAFGGRRDIMERLAPLGPVYQAGTLSGNPIAMQAGIRTLNLLSRNGVYERLEALSKRLEDGLSGQTFYFNRVGSMWSIFFAQSPVRNLNDVKHCDKEKFKKFFHEMLKNGIYLAPSPFESGFISLAHTEEDIDRTAGEISDFSLL